MLSRTLLSLWETHSSLLSLWKSSPSMHCFYPASGFAWRTSLPLADNKPGVPSYPFNAGWLGGQTWGQYAIFLGIIKISKFLLWPITRFSFEVNSFLTLSQNSYFSLRLAWLTLKSFFAPSHSDQALNGLPQAPVSFIESEKMISFVKQFHALLSLICL